MKLGQSEVASVLERALQGFKSADRPLLVIPSENVPWAGWGDLCSRDHQSRQLVHCRTVVDRICRSVRLTSDGVVVSAESFWEWAIQVPNDIDVQITDPLQVLDQLRQLGPTAVADIEPMAYRKLILFNGLHACVAALARQSGRARYDDIPTYIHEGEYGAAELEGLSFEFAQVVMEHLGDTKETGRSAK